MVPRLHRRLALREPQRTLFERHAHGVYNHCFRRTASWADAEEITSAVFAEAWRRRHEVRPVHESARPWLLGVANPKDLERRLNDLGVPAVVDFLASGFGCDDARSTGWLADQPGEALFHLDETDDDHLILHPRSAPSRRDRGLDVPDRRARRRPRRRRARGVSTTPVGPCVPVPDASIVDAEHGIAGG
jgi:Sigma-70 region 2